jgi:hypothetical protein
MSGGGRTLLRFALRDVNSHQENHLRVAHIYCSPNTPGVPSFGFAQDWLFASEMWVSEMARFLFAAVHSDSISTIHM